ncbi:MAG: DUF2971 domain-containing protein [Ruminococcus sp.]|nr:DUF2971 domain-containing protein [Ruminococcus sp.]
MKDGFIARKAEFLVESINKFKNIGKCDDLIVYHYTSTDGLLGILENNGSPKISLRFTQYDSLNDTKERQDIKDTLVEYCVIQSKKKLISTELVEKIRSIKLNDKITILKKTGESLEVNDGEKVEVKELVDNAESFTYLCCFSTNRDSLAMWNYYTKSNNYEGYSLGLAVDDIKISKWDYKPYHIEVMKVIYDKQDKFDLFEEYLLPILLEYDKCSQEDRVDILNIITILMNSVQFIFKNEHFKHEQEVRAILRVPKEFCSDEKISKRKYRGSNGYIVPYVELYLDKSALVNVTTAPLFEQDLAINNLSSMLNERGYPKVIIEPSSVPIRF